MRIFQNILKDFVDRFRQIIANFGKIFRSDNQAVLSWKSCNYTLKMQ